jgi:hypothetical protein
LVVKNGSKTWARSGIHACPVSRTVSHARGLGALGVGLAADLLGAGVGRFERQLAAGRQRVAGGDDQVRDDLSI